MDLRQRTTVLGNLVHGSPEYLGPPSRYFTDSSYAEFRRNHAGRDPLVFAGGGELERARIEAILGSLGSGEYRGRSTSELSFKVVCTNPVILGNGPVTPSRIS